MSQLAKAERLWASHKDRLAGGSGSAAAFRGTMGGLNDRDLGLDQWIPGYAGSSPGAQTEKMADYLVSVFKEKGLLPARLYAMADTRQPRGGPVRFGAILSSMAKVLPQLAPELLEQVPYAFQLTPEALLSREDFDMLFDVRASMAGASVGPAASALKKKNQLQKGGNDNIYVLKSFCEVLEKEKMSSARMFKLADSNFN